MYIILYWNNNIKNIIVQKIILCKNNIMLKIILDKNIRNNGVWKKCYIK